MKDCIIVCGYPTNEDGTISSILKSRMDKAIEIYRTNPCKMIVSGGSVHNPYSEALCMKDYAIKQGVKSGDILIENQAKSTYHNMMYSKEIMDKNHLQTCYVVTNKWHQVKANYYADKFNLDYESVSSNKPEDMSLFKAWLLEIYMPINMFINRLKGFS